MQIPIYPFFLLILLTNPATTPAKCLDHFEIGYFPSPDAAEV